MWNNIDFIILPLVNKGLCWKSTCKEFIDMFYQYMYFGNFRPLVSFCTFINDSKISVLLNTSVCVLILTLRLFIEAGWSVISKKKLRKGMFSYSRLLSKELVHFFLPFKFGYFPMFWKRTILRVLKEINLV